MNLKIFWIFFKISLVSFGGVFGVLPQLEKMVVVEQGWITHERFYQSYVMGQFLPGPNMAMCPLIGYWVNGWQGFMAGFLGIYLAPLLIMLATYIVYKKYCEIAEVKMVEKSMRPVIVGLIASSCYRLWYVQSGKSTISHSLGILFLFAGVYLYQAKKIAAMPLIFLFGGLWYIAGFVYL